MKKELKDYLAYYLGCKVAGTYDDASGAYGYLTGVTNGGYDCEIQFILEDGINVEEDPQYNDVKEVKPILRPLSDIQEIELENLAHVDGTYISNSRQDAIITAGNILKCGEYRPLVTKFLLDQHFDLFDLIPSGLAIDATTIKETNPAT